MKRMAVGLGTGVVLAGALVCLSAALTGCGTIALQDLLGENTCKIFNCETMFFLEETEPADHDDAADHDDMDTDDDHDGMDATEADDDHDDMDEGDDHADEEHDEDAMPADEQ